MFELLLLSHVKDRKEDLPKEERQSESESKRVYVQDCSFENRTYHVGEFVYVEPSEPNLKPHIVCIERMWEDEAGNKLCTFIAMYLLLKNNSFNLKYTINLKCDEQQILFNHSVLISYLYFPTTAHYKDIEVTKISVTNTGRTLLM